MGPVGAHAARAGSPCVHQRPHRWTGTIPMASGPDTHGLCEEHLSHGLENRALDTALGMGPAQRHRICLSQKPVCSLTPRANQLFFFL